MYGFVDQQGEVVIPLKYDEAGEFHKGLVKVELKGKWGYIDKNGNEYWDKTQNQAREQKPPFF